ncbi:hypothetical protein [Amycolatopsis jejuensis]|nr:hypothetical protein [Amycolatopsis jejuensis]
MDHVFRIANFGPSKHEGGTTLEFLAAHLSRAHGHPGLLAKTAAEKL